MDEPTSTVFVRNIKEILRISFIEIREYPLLNEDDKSFTAFELSDRFWVRLQCVPCLEGWILEFNDRRQPLDWLNFEVPLMDGGLLDVDGMKDVAEGMRDIVVERMVADLLGA